MRKSQIDEAKEIISKRWTKSPDWIKELAIVILDKYGKYIYEYTWLSGSSTEVYPISIWLDYMEVQLNTTDKRHFTKKGLQKIVERFPRLKGANFSKRDGSCPNALLFFFR